MHGQDVELAVHQSMGEQLQSDSAFEPLRAVSMTTRQASQHGV